MIDYSLIYQSIVHYESIGFTRIETPWTVTPEVSSITKPNGKTNMTISEKEKVLVASGEQSFLYLYLKGYLPKGSFQTVTPCWREDRYDGLHQKCFIKNELIETQKVNQQRLSEIVNLCREFFESVLEDQIEVEQTDEGYDLAYGGIELGSYGIRRCPFLEWIYATGCAEPRLSYVKNLKRKGWRTTSL
jgi:hypothetical protein